MLLGLASRKIEMATLSIMSRHTWQIRHSFSLKAMCTRSLTDKRNQVVQNYKNWYFLGYQIYFYITCFYFVLLGG